MDKKEKPDPHHGLEIKIQDKPTVINVFSLNVKYFNKIRSPTRREMIIKTKVKDP
jgi:hypothetical protein